jgi:hypothetical protein
MLLRAALFAVLGTISFHLYGLPGLVHFLILFTLCYSLALSWPKLHTTIRLFAIGVVILGIFSPKAWMEESSTDPEPAPAPAPEYVVEPLPDYLVGDYLAFVEFENCDPQKPQKIDPQIPLFSTTEKGLTLTGGKEQAFTFVGAHQISDNVYAFKLDTGADTYFVAIASSDWGGRLFLQERKKDTDEFVHIYVVAITPPAEAQ